MMMIRSMSPEVMIADEIGRMEDAEALLEAVHAGVSVIVSAHGSSYADIDNILFAAPSGSPFPFKMRLRLPGPFFLDSSTILSKTRCS